MTDGRLGNCGNQAAADGIVQLVPSIQGWPRGVSGDVLASSSHVAGFGQACVHKRQQQGHAGQTLHEKVVSHLEREERRPEIQGM